VSNDNDTPTTIDSTTTSKQAFADCGAIIERFRYLQQFIKRHAALLDKFGSTSIYHSSGTTLSFFLHGCPGVDDCKALARIIGGEWKRVPKGDGSVNYETAAHDAPLHVVMFNVERAPETPLAL
jgi:hypothetical protein